MLSFKTTFVFAVTLSVALVVAVFTAGNTKVAFDIAAFPFQKNKKCAVALLLKNVFALPQFSLSSLIINMYYGDIKLIRLYEMAKVDVLKMGRYHYANKEDELRDAYNSTFKLWRDYLRLSKDYWWVCKQKGNTFDEELKKMYEHFGDVFELGFNDWWRIKGRDLFIEQLKLPAVKEINAEFTNLSPTPENYLIAEIPLNVSERTIVRQLKEILRARKDRKVVPKSSAKRKLTKYKGVRKKVLRKAHEVWCLNHLVKMAKQEGSNIGAPFNKLTTHQMGVGMRLVRNCMPKAGDGVLLGRKKRDGMAVGISRMLGRANALIANAEIGIFPSYEKVEPRKRWTDEQQKELDAAVARGEWLPPDIPKYDFDKMFEKVPVLPTSFKMDIDGGYYKQSNVGHRSDG